MKKQEETSSGIQKLDQENLSEVNGGASIWTVPLGPIIGVPVDYYSLTKQSLIQMLETTIFF